MARFTGSKNKVARRFGTNVFGRTRNPLLHKPNPPGVHGARKKKKSDFGLQLEEKQKLKAVYGMLSEKQLVHYYQAAVRKHSNTPLLLAQTLESRLDTLIYRMKFAQTPFAAQQLVSHGHILVDGKKVNRRSFLVQPGMVVSIKESSRQIKPVQNALQSPLREVPVYLAVDKEHCSGQMLLLPEIDQIPWPLAINLHEVCDFLAHAH